MLNGAKHPWMRVNSTITKAQKFFVGCVLRTEFSHLVKRCASAPYSLLGEYGCGAQNRGGVQSLRESPPLEDLSEAHPVANGYKSLSCCIQTVQASVGQGMIDKLQATVDSTSSGIAHAVFHGLNNSLAG